MAIKAAVLKLVMLVCMDSECIKENAFEVDRYYGGLMDALDDCRPKRDARRNFYQQHGISGVEFHCWTPAEIRKMGFK